MVISSTFIEDYATIGKKCRKRSYYVFEFFKNRMLQKNPNTKFLL